MTTRPAARVLIVEDEMPMRTALADILASEGYRVLTASDGAAGLNRAIEEAPDLLLLDVMLPKLDGYALCAELRRLGVDTPVLMITAKAQVQDRVIGLDSGSDDYLVKPFSTDELLARVRALLRRTRRPCIAVSAIMLGDVRVDFASLTARRGLHAMRLTAKEYAVLKLLAEARGEVVTREKFLDLVWKHAAFPSTRTVDNHIASLRAKLEPDAAKPRWILTVHGAGYRLEMDGAILQNADNSENHLP
jgi:DNA-binding response OmpR family regulator